MGTISGNRRGQGIGTGLRQPHVEMGANPLEAGLRSSGEESGPRAARAAGPLPSATGVLSQRFVDPHGRAHAPSTGRLVQPALASLRCVGHTELWEQVLPAFHTRLEQMNGHRT